MTIRLFAELKSSLSTLNCAIVLNRLEDVRAGESVEVMVESNSITIVQENEPVVFLFPDLELSPPSCRGLSYSPFGEVQFSLEAKQTKEADFSYPPVSSCQNDTVEKIQTFQNRCFCSVCGEKLFRNSCIFTRVLPLPSDSWSESADMWFCHNHDDSSIVASNLYQPKSRECFVGETSILVNSCDVKTEVVKVTSDGVIKCTRCSGQIGVTEWKQQVNGTSHYIPVYELYLHMLQFTDPFLQELTDTLTTQQRETASEDFFARFLKEQSKMYTSYRFIINSKSETGGLSHCLVWLLDQNASIYTSSTDHADQGSVLQNDRGLKLLYRGHLIQKENERQEDKTTDPVIRLWKNDNTVHALSLSRQVFLYLVNSLIKSTKSLPKTQRFLNGFHVGFLYHCRR